jgi:hypothetical protein
MTVFDRDSRTNLRVYADMESKRVKKGKNFLSNHQKGIFVEYVSFLQEKPESRGKRRGGGKRKEFSDAG